MYQSVVPESRHNTNFPRPAIPSATRLLPYRDVVVISRSGMPTGLFVGELHEFRSRRSRGKPMIDLVLQPQRLLVHLAPNLFVVVTRDDVSSPGRSSQHYNDDAYGSSRLSSPRHRRIVTVSTPVKGASRRCEETRCRATLGRSPHNGLACRSSVTSIPWGIDTTLTCRPARNNAAQTSRRQPCGRS